MFLPREVDSIFTPQFENSKSEFSVKTGLLPRVRAPRYKASLRLVRKKYFVRSCDPHNDDYEVHNYLIVVHRRFGGTHCLHLQSQAMPHSRRQYSSKIISVKASPGVFYHDSSIIRTMQNGGGTESDPGMLSLWGFLTFSLPVM
jgi:hypothetical protein